MRIVAGSRRGARIQAPPGLGTRPTSDRAREAAFALIGPVDGAAVADLFAGSGAMGLEALSRGAARCLFVEQEAAACAAIRANLEKLRLEGAEVRRGDALRALADEAAAGRRYDLVLLDPPYEMLESILPKLAAALPSALARDGVAVVESAAGAEPVVEGLRVRTSRRYGAARITLLEHE